MSFQVSPLEFERRNRLLKQSDIARMTGIPQSRLSLIERGEGRANEREIKLIAEALDVSVQEVEELINDRAEFVILRAYYLKRMESKLKGFTAGLTVSLPIRDIERKP